ncbi:MAG: glycosyltransferase family 4 protein [Solirubrobacterales bacterium]
MPVARELRVLTVGNMYPPHHLGGYELMWRSSVEHLRARGAEVRVLTTDHREPEPDAAFPEDPDAHRELRWYWYDHEFPRRGLGKRLRIERSNLATLERHLDELRPDAVCWWAMGGMSMSLVERGRRLGMPAVGVVVDEWLGYGPRVDAWQRAFGRPLALALAVERLSGVPTALDLAGAARWVFVSDYLRERARAAGVDPFDSEVAHGGVDRPSFPVAPERPWQGRLLYLGRIDERKGIETAIRALADLEQATLRVIGSGDRDYAERLRRLVADLGFAARVSFEVLPRDRVGAAYAEADAVLFPVLWPEPWGLVPLEAMSVGRPVVATGTGGSAEYLRDGENCLLFEPHDSPTALAAAVRRLADDDGLRRTLRAGGLDAARAHTEESFNEAVAGALADVVAR